MSTKSLVGIDLENHAQVINELCSRLYQHKGRKVSVEKKVDMKARIKKSPDLADSLTYAVEMLRRAGLEFTFAEESESLDIQEIRDWERHLIFEKGKNDDPASDEDMSYAGNSFDEDGF
jgi:hypothetical protein